MQTETNTNNDRAITAQRRLQDRNLRYLLETGAFRFIDKQTPWFPYTSGQIGPYYVQSVSVEKNGAAYAAAIDGIIQLSREAGEFDAISGGETRDWDFSNPTAVALRKPHLKLYKDGRVLGAEIAGQTFLHVADLNNEGSSVRDYWKPLIERHGGRLLGVISFVDRMEEGVDVLRNLGLRIFSVVPLDRHAWETALAAGFVTRQLCDLLLERMRDRQVWAEQTLLENPEFFRKFYQAPNTRAKAERILKTYPAIAKQLQKIAESDAD